MTSPPTWSQRRMLVRVRLRFESTPLHYAQKCWFTFDREKCRLVGDVAHLIGTHFGLNQRGINGIQLFMDDFLVPTNEIADVIRDNDLLEVRVVDVSNGLLESSSTASTSSPEVQLPRSKKTKMTKNEKDLKNTPSHDNTTKLKTSKASMSTAQKNTNATSRTSSKSTHTDANNIKKLRVSETKTAYGGVHLTFTSSSPSSSSSSSDSDSSSSSEDNRLRPAQSILTPANKLTPLNNKPATNEPKTQTDTKAACRGSGRGRGRGRGRGGRQRGRSSLPSNLIIGGPDDVHSTQSTVYKSNNVRAKVGVPSSPKVTPVKARPVAEEKGKKVSSGWDVKPNKEEVPVISKPDEAEPPITSKSNEEEVPVISKPTKDYSSFQELEGAPRVGDCLAFKLLELSGSCTPQVSQYKEATVLAYDSTSKTVKVKYHGPSKTAPDNATSRLARFALEQESLMEQENPEVELALESLVSPRLIPSS